MTATAAPRKSKRMRPTHGVRPGIGHTVPIYLVVHTFGWQDNPMTVAVFASQEGAELFANQQNAIRQGTGEQYVVQCWELRP